ncbi:MAG: hypothetical protein IT422_17210 [Pirellulaceae bacterium]|nr:hypothetical protein [Pirellulaceae bacterium]
MDDPKDWRSFEIAVAKFIEAIAHDAKVTHDESIPDAHTGHPRQRDVWIESTLGGLFPFKALASCKYLGRVLNEQDIDHFNGEFISSKANVGILYSRQGYDDRALEKASVLGFPCCKLYTNEPPELPSQLVFGLAFHFTPQNKCWLSQDLPGTKFRIWNDVFDLKLHGLLIRDIVIEQLDQFQTTDERDCLWEEARSGSGFALDISSCVNMPNAINVVMSYRARRARGEFSLISGSYNFTSELFVGEQCSPWLDTHSADPGPGWEEVTDLPLQMPVPLVAFYMGASSISAIAEYGNMMLH